MQETYKIEKRNWAAKLMAIVVVVTMVTSTFVLFAPEASARTGSDSYGYSFKDSVESDGPTYAWTDIVSSGSKLLGSTTDGAQGPFDIGFDFEFMKLRMINSTTEEIMVTLHSAELLRMHGPLTQFRQLS